MQPDDSTADSLVTRVMRGDQNAFDLLVDRYHPRLRAFVRLRFGPNLRAKESATDLVQSVCRELFGDRGGFQFQGETAFRNWLFTAAARKIADRAEHWNAARRDVAREVRPDEDQALLEIYRASAFSPSQIVAGREAMERIERAFDELPEDYREAIVLSRLLGMSRAEVAEKMGKTEDSVRHLLFRGLAQLSRILEKGS